MAPDAARAIFSMSVWCVIFATTRLVGVTSTQRPMVSVASASEKPESRRSRGIRASFALPRPL
jgi:hypothetical protein